MIGLASFGRTLAFAASVGLAAPMALAVLRPMLGGPAALTLYGVGAASFYAAGLARRPTQGLAAACLLFLANLGLLLAGGTPHQAFLLSAVLLGVLRSGYLQRDPRAAGSFARTLAVEISLLGTGLVLASVLARGSFFPISLALWGFFLVQSAFFLIGGPEAQRARAKAAACEDGDPFERAAQRARGLLGRDPAH